MGKVAIGVAVVCGIAVAGAAAVGVHRKMKKSGRWVKAMEILKEFEEKCGTPIPKLKQMADAMIVEMHAGLASEGGSKLKMLISYVDHLPTGYAPLRRPLSTWLGWMIRVQLGGKGRGIVNQQFEEVSIPPS
ncbi:hypothetical protein J1N35_031422 [Gossypium stocksii]|uniref:Phosphotransferase n=1 Tax=Gossypium stocksii TaxID=47602 RepID=A0A9D3V133_9ROSI|nr:hypothetical protein J1N35_031422 [Gossypium stocksii]